MNNAVPPSHDLAALPLTASPKRSRKHWQWLILAVLLALVIWFLVWFFNKNVEDAKSEPHTQAATASAQSAESGAHRLTITVQKVTQQNVADELPASGAVQAWQEASIGSENGGLRLTTVLVNVGDTVKKGQVLATLDPQQVQSQLALAKAQHDLAYADAQRAKSIAQSDALSKQQLDQYVTQERVAKAQLEQAVERANNAVIRAPDSGIISARSASVGAVVAPGQELFRYIRAGRLEWRAEFTPEAAGRIRIGAKALIHGPHTAPGQFVSGTVRAIAPIADSQTRNVIVYVDLPSDSLQKGWRGGMYASGTVATGERQVLTIAQQAVVVRDGFHYAFVVQTDGRVQERKLKTGLRQKSFVEVLEGVKDGETVAVQGAGFLHDQDMVRVSPTQNAQ